MKNRVHLSFEPLALIKRFSNGRPAVGRPTAWGKLSAYQADEEPQISVRDALARLILARNEANYEDVDRRRKRRSVRKRPAMIGL